jgi:drug/metabolite transporter (DMT)-like permease
MKLSSERLGLIVLIAGAAIIGLSPIFVRLSDAGPSATGFWRLAFAAPLLAILTAIERPPAAARTTNRFAFTPLMLLAGALFAADLASWHYGIHFTSVANATVLSNGTPILVTAAAWLLLRERPQRMFAMGMSLAIGGAVVMALAQAAPTTRHGAGSAPLLGDALSLSTAVWYGGYFLAVRELRKTASASAVMFWSSVAGLPLLILAAMLLREPFTPATALGWEACVGLGLVHVSGQGAIAWALGRVPTALASVVVLVQPVVAAALGWLIFGEVITPLQGLGAALALAGVAVAQMSAKTPPLPPEP